MLEFLRAFQFTCGPQVKAIKMKVEKAKPPTKAELEQQVEQLKNELEQLRELRKSGDAANAPDSPAGSMPSVGALVGVGSPPATSRMKADHLFGCELELFTYAQLRERLNVCSTRLRPILQSQFNPGEDALEGAFAKAQEFNQQARILFLFTFERVQVGSCRPSDIVLVLHAQDISALKGMAEMGRICAVDAGQLVLALLPGVESGSSSVFPRTFPDKRKLGLSALRIAAAREQIESGLTVGEYGASKSVSDLLGALEIKAKADLDRSLSEHDVARLVAEILGAGTGHVGTGPSSSTHKRCMAVHTSLNPVALSYNLEQFQDMLEEVRRSMQAAAVDPRTRQDGFREVLRFGEASVLSGFVCDVMLRVHLVRVTLLATSEKPPEKLLMEAALHAGELSTLVESDRNPWGSGLLAELATASTGFSIPDAQEARRLVQDAHEEEIKALLSMMIRKQSTTSRGLKRIFSSGVAQDPIGGAEEAQVTQQISDGTEEAQVPKRMLSKAFSRRLAGIGHRKSAGSVSAEATAPALRNLSADFQEDGKLEITIEVGATLVSTEEEPDVSFIEGVLRRHPQPVSGLKWIHVGPTEPAGGRRILNQKLSDALRVKTKFSRLEVAEFELAESDLDQAHYVKAGDDFFKPLADVERSRFQWSAMTSVVRSVPKKAKLAKVAPAPEPKPRINPIIRMTGTGLRQRHCMLVRNEKADGSSQVILMPLDGFCMVNGSLLEPNSDGLVLRGNDRLMLGHRKVGAGYP